MGGIEYIDPAAFEEEPGTIMEPTAPEPDEPVQVAPEPSEGPEGTVAPEGVEAPEGGDLTVDELQTKLQSTESELDTIKRSFGKQGNELHTLRTAMDMMQGQAMQQPQMQPQQAEVPDDVDPATATFIQNEILKGRQQDYLLDIARRDSDFVSKKGISAEVSAVVQKYQALNQVANFKDAYYSMVKQEMIIEDKEPAPPARRVAVTPDRPGPKLATGGKGVVPKGELNPANVDWDKLGQASPQVRKEALRTMHDQTGGK